MVCDKCGAKLILDKDDKIKCPDCSRIIFLSKEEALYVVQKQFDWFNNGFTQVLNRYEKRRLILWILGEREKISSQFFTNTPRIPLNDFLSMNVLIKRIVLNHKDNGKELADEKNTSQLIDTFSGFIRIAERYNLIKDDFGHIVAKKNLNPDKIDYNMLMSNYTFVINEDWFPIMNTFDEHLIMGEEQADKQLKKFEDEYKKVRKGKSKPIKSTPEEIVKKLYPTLLDFSCALNKNKMFKEAFDFNYLKEADIPPDIFLAIINDFPLKHGVINSIKPKEFRKYIKKKFKDYDSKILYDKLVFSYENQEVFPLFMRLENHLLISICFSRLIGLFYYPFYYRDLFLKETQKISDLFEKTEVPKKFEENGFKVRKTIIDKKKSTLEIDTLAWKNDIIYVIETKIWDIKPMFEHKFTHLNRERDIKGIVDGKKYTTKGGKLSYKEIPSLISKIKFVKDNLKHLCDNPDKIISIKGIIITKSYPPLRRYKDIMVFAFNEIGKI